MMRKYIEIAGRKIGQDYLPYLIAEMSANHNGSIENAFKIIQLAKNSGADAIKMQTYTPDSITLNTREKDFIIGEGLWAGKSLYELYEWAHTPWEWHKPLFEFSRKIELPIFSTPFDETAVDFLEDLNVPAYKIASFENIDHRLIAYAASTKKPLIISTGMASKDEISEAENIARESGCKELALLHCVSGYPAPASDYNLRTLLDLQDSFDAVIGLSDHTLGVITSLVAISLGASIIEKHFTLDRDGGGPDDSFSMMPEDFLRLSKDSKVAFETLGAISYERKLSEQSNLKFRRSLYFTNDLKVGHLITVNDIKSVRPGYGLPPKYYGDVLGQTIKRDVKKHKPVHWEDINNEIMHDK
jgi:N-acetylneuraminate synthase